MKTNMKTIFVVVQLFLYIVFIILDLRSGYTFVSSSLKLLTIGLCLMWLIGNLIFETKHSDNKGSILKFKWMTTILSFTFVSDIFLLFTKHYTVGIATFIMVQILYACMVRKVKLKRALVIVLLVSVFGVIIFIFSKTNTVFTESFLMGFEVLTYAILFISNLIVYGSRSRLSDRNKWLFIGLCLYAICDLQVAIYNLPPNSVIPSSVIQFVAIGMWLFYLPGQVLLTLSANKKGYL